ncbi:MAG: GNAT family N-acetyltransferase [Pseudomonadota bacterium]
MNAPFKPDTLSDADAFDTLAAADQPDRSYLRAQWFASGPDPATKLAVARDASGAPLAGFALRPKSIGPAALGLHVNQIAGPYWPMRGVPLDKNASAQALASALSDKALARALGPAFRLGPVVRDHASIRLLREAFALAGWSVLSKPVGQHFAVDLATLTASGKWPSTRGQRKRRWHVRNMEKIAPVRFEYFTGTDWTAATRNAMAAIEANSWLATLEDGGDTKFLDPALRATWEDAAKDAALAAMIRGSLFWIGEDPVAFTFGLDCGASRLLIANNFDMRFKKESPGKVLIYDDFLKAAERGIAWMDLGLGDAGYKSDMGAAEVGTFVDLMFVQSTLFARALRPLWER